ncbi:hypothetical protein JMJ58_21225 (plasmid) [Haloterrigena salifodinae]|uniref:Halobacterial output domain-containing protein n=1 Tax=Haloterrigena salifodinae TaxID=2675099 RepID=A0A8T8E7Q9_9EURY|nr:HalOD1 output domain-containing protein [Haloterrigena salifodinae]QRV17476.1 hypothetical protein JMJ58_21225 [Haloterrigena salifodinae]
MGSTVTPTDTAVATTVVQRVATVTDREVTQLPSLYDAIDPDALEAVIRSIGTEASMGVRFSYAGHRIIVDGTGTVNIESESAGAEESH